MKTQNYIFDYFFNKDISVTNKGKLLKMSGIALQVGFEGSMSQILYLGPR